PNRVLERHAVHLLQVGHGSAHPWQHRVRILCRAPVTGIVLGAALNAMLLEGAEPHGRVLADPHGVGAEGARLDDGVLRLEIEVAHRPERPVDPDRTSLGRGDHATGARGIEIVEPAQRRGGRQLGEPPYLLCGTPLEIGADEERAPGLLLELAREGRHRFARPPEHDESAHACGERRVDLGPLVVETLAPPAQRGKHEARERQGTGSGHAGVMWPSTRGPRAPVAAGRFPGVPRIVRKPRNANTRASFASPSKNSRSNGTTGRGATRAVRSSTSRGLRAPPPEITSSSRALAGVQRSIPWAMVSTVSAVAVATASLSDPPACFTSSTSRA